MKKTPEEENKKKSCIFTKNLTMGSSVSASTNKPPGFSVSGASTLNGLFQTINRLKRLVSYSKRFH